MVKRLKSFSSLSQIQAAEMSFLHQVSGLHFRDKVHRVESSQLRCLSSDYDNNNNNKEGQDKYDQSCMFITSVVLVSRHLVSN